MEIADDVVIDGSMDVTEARRFLRGTQYEGFMRWLTEDRLSHFKRHDADESGTLELGELQEAVRAYLKSQPGALMDNVMQQYQEAGGGSSANRANPTRNDETLNRTLDEYSSSAGGMKKGPQGASREEAQFLPLVSLIERSQGVAELKRLFQYYCALQEAQPVGLEMSSQKFGKLCLDSGVIDGSLNAGVVNIVFLQAIRSGEERRSRMSWEQFMLGLAMVSARKFPLYPSAEALQIVLDNHVMLLAKKLSGEGRLPQVSSDLQSTKTQATRRIQGSQTRPKQQATMPGQDVQTLAYRFCELHELPGEEAKLVSIYGHYAKGAGGISRQGFLKLVGDSQLMDRHLPQKQVMVIFMTAANSKAEDATLGMQQLLDALCMVAARKFADASSRVAGTQFLLESYVLPYAAAL